MKIYVKASTNDLYSLDNKILAYLGDRLIDRAYQDENRISYIFKINNHNVYRVLTDDKELIFQALKYASKLPSNGKVHEVYDDPQDIDSIKGSVDIRFHRFTSLIDLCEKDNPNFTEYIDED